MTIDRLSPGLVALCLLLTVALEPTPLAQTGAGLFSSLPGGASSALGTDGVGGIERLKQFDGGNASNAGPQSPQGAGGLVTPISPTPPPANGVTNSLHDAGWSDLGHGLPGAMTTPHLEIVLFSQEETRLSMLVSGGPPGQEIHFVVGASRQLTPFQGGVLVPSADLLISGLALDPQGALLVPLTAIKLLPPMMIIYLQAWIPDASNSQGYSATNAIALLIPQR